MDFNRPKRCPRQRTGREDRHSNFYEIPDNLQPEARLTELPVSTADLRQAFGPEFNVGMPVSCDRCLGDCEGIDDPLLERESELVAAAGEVN
jgi:hypothetical protein